MTICIAAICGRNMIVGASDRMITAGDIEFEPPLPKNFPLTSNIVIQWAGDAAVQTEVLHAVMNSLAKVPKPVDVHTVATLYSQHYMQKRLEASEHDILLPLNLNRDSWLTKQSIMDSNLVDNIAKELMNYDYSDCACEVLISGVDTTGAHIYRVDDGAISCEDDISFAAIGVGEWHAESQLMFDRHISFTPLPETLFSVYSAKKRAEVAPGVGGATDMFAIIQSYSPIDVDTIRKIEAIYKTAQKRTQKARILAKSEVENYVNKLIQKASTQRSAQTQIDKPSTSSNTP